MKLYRSYRRIDSIGRTYALHVRYVLFDIYYFIWDPSIRDNPMTKQYGGVSTLKYWISNGICMPDKRPSE